MKIIYNAFHFGHVNVVEWFRNNGYYEEENNTWDELVSGGMYDYQTKLYFTPFNISNAVYI